MCHNALCRQANLNIKKTPRTSPESSVLQNRFFKELTPLSLKERKKYEKKQKMWHLSDWLSVLLKEFSFFVSMSQCFLAQFSCFWAWPSRCESSRCDSLWFWPEKFDSDLLIVNLYTVKYIPLYAEYSKFLNNVFRRSHNNKLHNNYLLDNIKNTYLQYIYKLFYFILFISGLYNLYFMYLYEHHMR